MSTVGDTSLFQNLGITADWVESQRIKSETRTDLSKQFQKINLPMFSGDKTKFEERKAHFTVCADSNRVSTTHKLVR